MDAINNLLAIDVIAYNRDYISIKKMSKFCKTYNSYLGKIKA